MQLAIIQMIYHAFMTYLIAQFNIYLGFAYVLYKINQFFVQMEAARIKEKMLSDYLNELKKGGKNED
jgi:hypothetical protein